MWIKSTERDLRYKICEWLLFKWLEKYIEGKEKRTWRVRFSQILKVLEQEE
jgi:hypothetical protein